MSWFKRATASLACACLILCSVVSAAQSDDYQSAKKTVDQVMRESKAKASDRTASTTNNAQQSANQPSSTQVIVKGLFKNTAIVIVNGRQAMIKVGQTTAEGVKLLSANAKSAEFIIDGKRKTLLLSQGVGTTYSENTVREVRLQSKHNGHFFGSAKIKGHTVQFLVDTGASAVSMSSNTAKRIGLDYKRGRILRISTAQGITKGFQVSVRRIWVGSISLEDVPVVVLEGEYPLDVLLGNSFLSRVDMRVENGVMVLQSR